MKLIYTDHFQKRLQKKIEKRPQIREKVRTQLQRLVEDCRHPSLKTHKLQGSRGHEYAIWIEGNIRITFSIEKDAYLLTDIINHDEY